MKIAYLLHFNSDMHSGVFKKIQDQVKWWIKFKNEVKLFILTRNYDLKNSIINSELKDIVEIEVYVPNLDLYSLTYLL